MEKDNEKTTREKLEELQEKHGGKIMHDKQFGAGVHVSAFHYITEDGTHIHEWP